MWMKRQTQNSDFASDTESKDLQPRCDQPTEREDCVFSQVGIECSFTSAELIEAQEHLGFNTGLTLGFIKYIYWCNTLVYKVYWCNPWVTWLVSVGVFCLSNQGDNKTTIWIRPHLNGSHPVESDSNLIYLLKSIWNHCECGSNQIPVYLFVFRLNLTHIS